MERHRQGENGPIPKRHQRLFLRGSHWYVATREAPIGPFNDYREALYVARNYVNYLKNAPELTPELLKQG